MPTKSKPAPKKQPKNQPKLKVAVPAVPPSAPVAEKVKPVSLDAFRQAVLDLLALEIERYPNEALSLVLRRARTQIELIPLS